LSLRHLVGVAMGLALWSSRVARKASVSQTSGSRCTVGGAFVASRIVVPAVGRWLVRGGSIVYSRRKYGVVVPAVLWLIDERSPCLLDA